MMLLRNGNIVAVVLIYATVSSAYYYEDNNILPIDDYEDYEAETEQEPENCVCVPYWQCKEDFSGLVEDGVDIMDVRISSDPIESEVPNNSQLQKEISHQQSSAQHCTGDFDVCCRIQCGRTNQQTAVDPQLRSSSAVQNTLIYRITDGVDGGKTTKPGNVASFAEFPWMLGVLQDKVYKCGASLIHPQIALTAAHCVSSPSRSRPVTTQAAPFIVRAGEYNWESTAEPLPYQDRTAREIVTHGQYHAGSLRNDIALVVLDKPFQIAENVGVACVPPRWSATQARNSDGNRNCIATGWGKNGYKHGVYQATLKKMPLPLVPAATCLHSLRTARLGPFYQLHRSFLCAGGEANRDTCKGDGGSPLVCPIVDSDRGATSSETRYEQVGIVSWGLTCGVQNTPGVYVNVALFSDWIDGEVAARGFDSRVYKSDDRGMKAGNLYRRF